MGYLHNLLKGMHRALSPSHPPIQGGEWASYSFVHSVHLAPYKSYPDKTVSE